MAPPEAAKPPTRRQAAAQETRRKLLHAALENFSRRPYGEVTVGDIARTAGVAHGLLSHHFQGKESLYAEVVREIDQQLRAATEFASEGPVVDRLRQHFTAHLRFLAAHEDVALHLVLRRAQATDLASAAFEATREEGVRTICAVLGLDADDPALLLAMRGFGAACDEMSLLWLRNGRPVEAGTLAEAWIALLAGSLRAAHALAPRPALREALRTLGQEDAAATADPSPEGTQGSRS
ncbi:TetR/AcrR family transcriptional regulator [Streptomyces sp. NWU49]|uniref:TetR/AcrR family transcriptional regulator n=1 Tax=Streptomyces sp. NWU49 TaxID=2201153 RepID=UPI0015E7F3A3|nr:TetR family transcriptional regulator [Streptomyces sp. NWU49]